MKAIILGFISTIFFASTYVLNRSINLGGGSWIWSATLRYMFMILPLFLIVLLRGNLTGLIHVMKRNPGKWILWSTVGFGLFYAPLTYAAAYGPSWIVASTFQITIVAGSLLVPFFYEVVETKKGIQKIRRKIPVKGLLYSLIILLGIAVIQIQQFQTISVREVLTSVIFCIIAAFAYPLGNRKMMEICGEEIDVSQRVLGMTMASMPFWVLLSAYGFFTTNLPGKTQIFQAIIVALSSGVVATLLFFKATDMTKGDVHQLAAVEAAQCGEVIFSLLGELILLKGQLPNTTSFIGLGLVIFGMILHSFFSHSSDQPILVEELSG